MTFPDGTGRGSTEEPGASPVFPPRPPLPAEPAVSAGPAADGEVREPGPAADGEVRVPGPEADGEVSATGDRPPLVRRWLVWAAIAVVVLCGLGAGGAVWHSNATTAWEDAAVEYRAATVASDDAADAAATAVDERERYLENGRALVDIGTAHAELIDSAATAGLEDAANALVETVEEARAVIDDEPAPLPSEPPAWPWERTAAADALSTAAAAADERVDEIADAEASVAQHAEFVADASDELLASVTTQTEAIEAANVSARRGDVIDFRSAASAAALETSDAYVDSDAPERLENYVAAVEALQASQAAELAEKAGPLRDTRLEVEAFARSISGGVLLDFDWAPEVNGAGPDGRVGGLATWDGAAGGSASITLSDSVAERWPEDIPKALVAHEVGHAMAGRCYDLFDWRDRTENEAWATAWALSMGFTADGNGVSIYGYPRQELIDAAATCR